MRSTRTRPDITLAVPSVISFSFCKTFIPLPDSSLRFSRLGGFTSASRFQICVHSTTGAFLFATFALFA